MPGLTIPVTPRDHARGPGDARITLVEYGDLECPHCAMMHPIIGDIAQELSDSLRVVFRHFPLTKVHPHAQRAAEATEAAASQGRFWDMVDLLYQNHEDLGDDALLRYARKAKLAMKQFTRELEEKTYAARVRADFLGGIRGGVNGTPTFFINGQRYEGALDFDALVGALLRASKV